MSIVIEKESKKKTGTEENSNRVLYNFDEVPEFLLKLDRWVPWKFVWRDGPDKKPTKVPIDLNGFPFDASLSKGFSFDEAHDFYLDRRLENGSLCVDGLGISLGRGVAGIDMDKVLTRTDIQPWAKDTLDRINSYSDVSPSNKGVKILFRIDPLAFYERQVFHRLSFGAQGEIEFYHEKRYFTVTGRPFPGCPLKIRTLLDPELQAWHDEVFAEKLSHSKKQKQNQILSQGGDSISPNLTLREGQVLEVMRSASNWEKVETLMRGGDTEKVSENDASLAAHIAWYTGPNPSLIEAIMRKSGRVREKWDSRRNDTTWLRMTVANSMNLDSYYTWRQPIIGDDEVREAIASYQAVVAEDVVTEEATAEEEAVEAEEAVRVEAVYSERSDPLFSYLWEGCHQVISDTDRARRIKSTKEALALLPDRGLLHDYVRYQLPCSDCPVIYHVASALVMAGHLLNRKVSLRYGQSEILPNIWAGILGESSVSHKSYAIGATKKLLQEAGYGKATITDGFTFEGLLQSIGGKYPPPDPDEPGDIDADNIWERCHEREVAATDNKENYLQGVGLFHLDEISTWLSLLSSNQNISAKSTITSWYDCPREFKKQTASQGFYFVYRPCISILGASTPDWLFENTKASDLTGGFLPRWMFFPAGKKDYILSVPDGGDDSLRDSLVDQIKAMIRLHSHETFDHNATSYLTYHKWRVAIEVEATNRGDGVVLSWINRLGIYALKVAMIFQASLGGGDITVATMNLATSLVDHILDRLREVLKDATFNPQAAIRAKVLKYVKKHAGTKGVIHSQVLRDLNISAREITDATETLEQAESIRIVEHTGKNNRKAKTYFAD